MDRRREYLEERLKEAEAKIKAQNQVIRNLELCKDQYDSIMENMSEFVERSDPNFYLTYANKSLAAFYGATPEEMLNTDTMALVLEEDHEKIYEMMKKVSAENPHYKYEYRVKINGRIYWMESVGRGFYDEDGNIIEYQDVGRDITHFKNVEEQLKFMVDRQTQKLQMSNAELQQVNNYLHSILSEISEGILVIDKDGNSEFLNYGPKDLWKDAAADIGAYFRNLLNDKTSNALNWMFLKKRPFFDTEMRFVSGKRDLSFVISGVPLDNGADMVEKGILVLKPVTQVRKMVTRMSGNQARFRFKDIVTISSQIQDVIFLAQQAAANDCNVLIEGESGTGKELFAQSIHNASLRRNGPFVAVNCGALPRELVASELFGYVEGSFTGAKKGGKPGKFELADGGTIFLDEIGDMPLDQQIALLRVIQERCVTRVGGESAIPVDVRIICATNRDLQQEAKDRNFREDLYYRLNVIGLKIPPLRDRKDDIMPLFCSFWANVTGGKPEDFLKLLQPEAVDILLRYDWPGNVRELQNVADRMLYLAAGDEISAEYMPRHIIDAVNKREHENDFKHSVRSFGTEDALFENEIQEPTLISLKEARLRGKKKSQLAQRQELIRALEQENGNIAAASRRLGISRATFYRKMKEFEK
mgnify:CR=1 FL=1